MADRRAGDGVFTSAISRSAAFYRGARPEMLAHTDKVEQAGLLPTPAQGGYLSYVHRPDGLWSEVSSASLDMTDLVSVDRTASC